MCEACRVRSARGSGHDEEREQSALAPSAVLTDPALLADARLSRSSMRTLNAGLARHTQHHVGNRGMGRVLARNGDGTTATATPTPALPPIVKHKTGFEVDAMLLASSFFKPYIKPKYEKGIKADGHVNRHDQAAWDVEIAAYLKGKQNPNTGLVFTDDEAVAFGKNVNAFADGRQIHVNERRGEPATTVHESMHLFSHDDWLPAVGFNANEGATEYFTKKLCAENKMTRGNFYPKQHSSVKKLIEKVGEGVVADAFFNGDLATLKKRVDGARNFGEAILKAFGSKKIKGRAGTWDAWLAKMEAAKYDEADALL
jgi:hypothetical protein